LSKKVGRESSQKKKDNSGKKKVVIPLFQKKIEGKKGNRTGPLAIQKDAIPKKRKKPKGGHKKDDSSTQKTEKN